MTMPQPTAKKPLLQKSDGLFFVALLAHSPLSIEYGFRMWRTGHYQFFPLLIAAVFYLIFARVRKIPRVNTLPRLVYPLLGISGALLLASALLFSSTIWMVSFVFWVAVFIYGHWGWLGFKAAAPAWALLIFIVPVPGNLDVALVTKMQFMASQLASWILDAFGQIHFRDGVVLITEKKQFYTDEACSGIRSLFSSLAAISMYGVIRCYPLGRHFFNIGQTIVWVIVGNALRVATVVSVSDNWTNAIASGANHEMLGLIVFITIILLSLSTDRAINAWYSNEFGLDGFGLYEYAPDEFEADGKSGLTSQVACTGTSPPVARPLQQAPPLLSWCVMALFLVAFFASSRLYYKKTVKSELFNFQSTELAAVEADTLPNKINGWTRKGFDYEERNKHSLLAPESYIWKFSKNNKIAIVSLDGPYSEYHHLANCYSGLGWRLTSKDLYSTGEEDLAGALNCTQVKMDKNGEHGLVLFSAQDRTGNLIVPGGSFSVKRRATDLENNLRLILGLSIQQPQRTKLLPISQIQLLVRSSSQFSPEIEHEIQDLFSKVRQQLLQSPRFLPASGPEK